MYDIGAAAAAISRFCLRPTDPTHNAVAHAEGRSSSLRAPVRCVWW